MQEAVAHDEGGATADGAAEGASDFAERRAAHVFETVDF